jgi:hypothetical protein
MEAAEKWLYSWKRLPKAFAHEGNEEFVGYS